MVVITDQSFRASAHTKTVRISGLTDVDGDSDWVPAAVAGYKRLTIEIDAAADPGMPFTVPLSGAISPDGEGESIIPTDLQAYDEAVIENQQEPKLGHLLLLPNYIKVKQHGDSDMTVNVLLNFSR